jgi:hypothetical protein
MREPQPAIARRAGPARRLLRRCLGCLEMFDSEWAGERICRRCKGKAGWRGGDGVVLDRRSVRHRQGAYILTASHFP